MNVKRDSQVGNTPHMLDAICFPWRSWGHVVRTSNAVKPLCVLEDSRGVDFEEENHRAGAGV